MDGRWSIMVDHGRSWSIIIVVEPPPIILYSNRQWTPMAMVMVIELKWLNGKKGGCGGQSTIGKSLYRSLLLPYNDNDE